MGTVGRILQHPRLPIEVYWDNGEHNSYNRSDLELINKDKRKVKAKQKKAPKKRKKIIIPTIKISVKVFNVLSRALKNFIKRYGSEAANHQYPYCFLLGKNKNDIFTEITKLKRAGGSYGDECSNMVNISTSVIAQASMKIYKAHAIPCGVARVGNFTLGYTSYRGPSLTEVGKMGGFILSMTTGGIKIEQYIGKKVKTYKYELVASGKKSRIKSKKGGR